MTFTPSRWPLLALLLGPWLVLKQLAYSPPLEGVSPGPGVLAATAAVALGIVGVALRLRGRAQLVALLLLDAALTAVLHANVLYHRQFRDLASVSAFGFAAEAIEVRGAVRALLRPEDALLWVDVVLLLAAALVARGAWPKPLPPRHANRAVALAVLLFAAPALPLLDRPLTGPRRLALTRGEVARALNVAGYQLFDVASFALRRLARPARGDALREARAWHAARATPRGPLTGSQRGRNVVVLQLESVQAFAVGRRQEGVPVTPRLDALARESLLFTRAYAQVGQGTTSDAELLAGCSLYPLEAGAVFTDHHDGDFRCLPELLREAGYHTVAMHANWPNFWNRERMYPAMGYDRFYELRDFDREPVIGLGLADERFAAQATERLGTLPEPFYAVLVTLSNHVPFDDPALPRSLPLGPLEGTMVGRYLDSVRYTDGAVGVLLDRLAASGLLDRSVLVVYGDHHGVPRDAEGTEHLGLDVARPGVWLEHERRVPLLVRLPRGAHAGPRHAPAGQVDVAPTIADLLGLDLADTFFHGRSLVSAPPGLVILPDGSAVTEELVILSPEGRFGAPGCLDGEKGTAVPRARCDAIAEEAARALARSRAEVEGDLFRWMRREREGAAARRRVGRGSRDTWETRLRRHGAIAMAPSARQACAGPRLASVAPHDRAPPPHAARARPRPPGAGARRRGGGAGRPSLRRERRGAYGARRRARPRRARGGAAGGGRRASGRGPGSRAAGAPLLPARGRRRSHRAPAWERWTGRLAPSGAGYDGYEGMRLSFARDRVVAIEVFRAEWRRG